MKRTFKEFVQTKNKTNPTNLKNYILFLIEQYTPYKNIDGIIKRIEAAPVDSDTTYLCWRFNIKCPDDVWSMGYGLGNGPIIIDEEYKMQAMIDYGFGQVRIIAYDNDRMTDKEASEQVKKFFI